MPKRKWSAKVTETSDALDLGQTTSRRRVLEKAKDELREDFGRQGR